MKEFIKKLIARIMLESASCKIYKLINPNKEDIAEFNAYKKCIEIVNQVAEEYNNGWIPCSERLPEEYQMVLTCDKDGWVSTHINMPYKGVKNDFECGYYTAWQPLPQPYKENENGKI